MTKPEVSIKCYFAGETSALNLLQQSFDLYLTRMLAKGPDYVR